MKWLRARRRVAIAIGFGLAVASCGSSSSPPPKSYDEVRINDSPPAPTGSGSPAPEAASDPPSTASASAASAKGAGASPSPASSGSSAPVAVKPDKHEKKGLPKGSCDEIMDRYLDLLLSGPGAPMAGASPADLKVARKTSRDAVSKDPSMKGFMRECMKTATKSQYVCAVRAISKDEWIACLK